MLDVNLWGVIHGVRAFVPRILATGEEGHVVNVASMAAVQPIERLGPTPSPSTACSVCPTCCASRSRSIGAPVGVSVVMPGMIRTGMNPIGTVEPSTVAANIVDAIRNGRNYVFTDDHSVVEVEARLDAIRTARAQVLQ